MTTMTVVSPTGTRVAAQIREFVNRYPVKVLANDLSKVLGQPVELRTIRSWREGSTSPNVRHLEGLAALYGEAFIHHVFAPLLNESDADLGTRLDRLAFQADQMAHDVRNLRSDIDAETQAAYSKSRRAADGGQGGDASASGEALAVPRTRLARCIQTTSIVLSLIAIGVSLTNDDDILRTQGRYGGRPPAARTVRTGREAA